MRHRDLALWSGGEGAAEVSRFSKNETPTRLAALSTVGARSVDELDELLKERLELIKTRLRGSGS